MNPENNKREEKKTNLFYGSIIFGISIPIGLFIAINFGSQIESARENVSFFQNILLWILEWFFILVGLVIPAHAWKKFVKPYK